MTFLRPLLRKSPISSRQVAGEARSKATWRSMSTQSGDDAKKSPLLAKLHLEDGTVLVGRSFGSHEAVDGEVRNLSSHLL